MKYAYLHKNFRNLNFEKKVIFFAHALTLVFCFFPWFSAAPVYTENFFYNAFQGPTFLIGLFIFIISLSVFLLFADQLLEKQKINLPFSENLFYFVAGSQQLILLILTWSVLAVIGREFENHELRFGLFLIIIAQSAGLVATFLNHQIEQQNQTRNFFKHPNEKTEKNDSLNLKK